MLQRKEQLELERQILEKTDLLIETTVETSMLVDEERERKLENAVNIVVEMAVLLKDYLGGHPEHFETLLHELTRQKLPDENVLKSFGDFAMYLDTAIKKGLERYQASCTPDEQLPDEQLIDSPALIEENNINDLPEKTVYETGEPQDNIDSQTTKDDTDQIVNETDFSGSEVTEAEPVLADNVDLPDDQKAVGEKDDLADEPKAPVDFPADTADQPDLAPVSTDGDDGCNCHVANEHKVWNLALKQVFPNASITKDYNYKGVTFSYFLPEYRIAIDVAPVDKREEVWKEYYCNQEKIRLLSIQATENARLRQLVRTIRRSIAQNPDQIRLS